jgi:hypothetical protein
LGRGLGEQDIEAALDGLGDAFQRWGDGHPEEAMQKSADAPQNSAKIRNNSYPNTALIKAATGR